METTIYDIYKILRNKPEIYPNELIDISGTKWYIARYPGREDDEGNNINSNCLKKHPEINAISEEPLSEYKLNVSISNHFLLNIYRTKLQISFGTYFAKIHINTGEVIVEHPCQNWEKIEESFLLRDFVEKFKSIKNQIRQFIEWAFGFQVNFHINSYAL